MQPNAGQHAKIGRSCRSGATRKTHLSVIAPPWRGRFTDQHYPRSIPRTQNSIFQSCNFLNDDAWDIKGSEAGAARLPGNNLRRYGAPLCGISLSVLGDEFQASSNLATSRYCRALESISVRIRRTSTHCDYLQIVRGTHRRRMVHHARPDRELTSLAVISGTGSVDSLVPAPSKRSAVSTCDA